MFSLHQWVHDADSFVDRFNPYITTISVPVRIFSTARVALRNFFILLPFGLPSLWLSVSIVRYSNPHFDHEAYSNRFMEEY
jgi:hypothetical protein